MMQKQSVGCKRKQMQSVFSSRPPRLRAQIDGKGWFTLKDILQTSCVTHVAPCAVIH